MCHLCYVLSEGMIKACTSCQAIKEAPSVAPLHPWIWPTKPWEKIHRDYAGPFLNKTFLIVVEAHSKWPEVIQMTTTGTKPTVIVLRWLFASYGLPLQLVSDNGPQFTAAEFQQFLKWNGVKHIQYSPYHPSSNGLAEWFVRTFKQAMRSGETDGLSLAHTLINFLLSYSTCNNSADLVSDSGPLTHSTFADRYPVRHCRASDHWNIFT